MSSILVYAPVAGPRLRYIITEMLCRMSGLQVDFCTDQEIFRDSLMPRINYSRQAISDEEIQIIPQGLLDEKGICPQTELQHIFKTYQSFSDQLNQALSRGERVLEISFDIFAAGFFLISRYEEYLPFEADQHGRFSAAESVAFRNGFLERPLVQEWAFAFTALLTARYPQLKAERPSFRRLVTIDIDQAFKYKHKQWWRTLAGLLKDPASLSERIAVLLGRRADPFDIFEDLEKYFPQKNVALLFFVLLGDYGAFDKNTDYRNSAFRDIVKNLGERYSVGIHPSYASSSAAGYTAQQMLAKEANRLSGILGKAPLLSRQHFLKLRFPHTYRQLIQTGITEDFTMGYADRPGFRASTAMPFYWYDLEAEQATTLLVHPFQVMDVTLRKYLGLSMQQSREVVRRISEKVETYGGEFTIIWHNSSFDHSWQGWSPDF